MKTLTCKSLGGSCGLALHAETWDEMATTMTHHVEEYHPDTAKEMRKAERIAPGMWSHSHQVVWQKAREEYPAEVRA